MIVFKLFVFLKNKKKNISLALFFMDDVEEVQNVPRRHLRDASNLFEVPNNQ